LINIINITNIVNKRKEKRSKKEKKSLLLPGLHLNMSQLVFLSYTLSFIYIGIYGRIITTCCKTQKKSAVVFYELA